MAEDLEEGLEVIVSPSMVEDLAGASVDIDLLRRVLPPPICLLLAQEREDDPRRICLRLRMAVHLAGFLTRGMECREE